MTESETYIHVNSGSDSQVGIVASEVHNSNVYQISSHDPPQRKYEIGLRYLENGVPTQARELIGEAMARGHDTAEVRFHWVLAMLSKRSYRDLHSEERQQLQNTSESLRHYADNEWKRALTAICALMDCMNGSGSDPAVALKELHETPPRQRNKIVHHLDLVLTGGMKDSLWAETRTTAESSQTSNDRLRRVWAYFHPAPAKPRVRPPAEESTTPRHWIHGVLGSSLLAWAVGYLGWLVLQHAEPLSISAYVLMLAAGYVAARQGLEWGYRTLRLRTKEHLFFGQVMRKHAPEGGFANDVDRSFKHYTFKYAPKDANHSAWLADTAGIRNLLRDEIVEQYREQRTTVGQVNWLIRYHIRDIRTRWLADTLLDYREQYRTALTVKVQCSLALVVLVLTATIAMTTAMQTAPLRTVLLTAVALASGRAAALGWFHIISERRRVAEDWQEYEQRERAQQEEHQRWKNKLDDTRPSEHEMETWLNHDKTLFLDQSLQRYKLAWRDIIAHAFLQTPGNKAKRARVDRGPWRYSTYRIHLFLITHNGVREVNTELDFEHASFHGHERHDYRFDAFSSVHVTETNEPKYTLELTLTNGPSRELHVKGNPDEQQPTSEAHPRSLSQMNLETSGFTHTLHILEGIASEGKNWIHRSPDQPGS